ncbi:hypothetical protein EDD30_6503 [Couchioplanes caeruleus]|uniref:Uncharacterized protein n=1 Tax=Couchioplanes caeruleus TaxID=56438 RepID=A0A3N1GTS7_9ACTN|nr:hypothetical protein EDD30_6503 [Couchioplanes caeruleus]
MVGGGAGGRAETPAPSKLERNLLDILALAVRESSQAEDVVLDSCPMSREAEINLRRQ